MIEIIQGPLDPEAVTARVKRHNNGAVVTFLGTTRSSTDCRRVLHLEYEAYEPMAVKILERIVEEIQEQYSVEDIAIAHRIGRVAVGETSLVVSVSSPHRREAFEACQDVIERIKKIVPIWKKEFFEGGEVWVGNRDHVSIG